MSSCRIVIAALLMVALMPLTVLAKTDLSDWNNVQRLKVGSTVIVSTKKGERFLGDVRHVDNDSLILLVKVSSVARQAFELRREDVAEVRKRRSRALMTALGVAIGLGVGIGIGAISDARHPYSDDPGIGKALFGGLGALGGIGLGAALPLKGKKIYVAP
jgi:small nuclear ribonucleoprotein (snRNP)-like protein